MSLTPEPDPASVAGSRRPSPRADGRPDLDALPALRLPRSLAVR